MKIIYVSIVLIVMVLLFLASIKPNVSYGKNHCKSYGKEEESVQTLLDRISWSSNYKGRVNLWCRFLLMAMVLSFFGFLVSTDSFPSPLQYIRSTFVLLVILRAFHGYYNHHCDKFADYAINRNVGLIKRKLNITKKGDLSVFPHRFRMDSACYNFSYKAEH